ncbi:MAG TPA: type IV pilus assembly protein PilM [Syntrophorhabdaceae bacterium]|nr:type IV pilus assembly protein PilM [Syntrophorhabdaceae bacterium]
MILDKIKSIKLGFKSKETKTHLDISQQAGSLNINDNPKKKQKKEEKRHHLPSKIDILSKIGLSRTSELIGVDIGTYSIKICTLKKTKTGFDLLNVARKTYNTNLLTEGHIVDQDFLAYEIKNLISKNKIKSTIAASALSSYGAITKKIRIPLTEDMDIEKIKKSGSILDDASLIEVEIENSIPFQLKDVYYSYYVLGLDPEDENFINILFIVSKKEIVDGFINTFKMAGLKLVLLDLDLICLVNIVEQIFGLQGPPKLIVDLGASIMNMAIVKGEDIELTREIMLGGSYLTEQIQKALKISYEEAEEKKIKADPEVTYLFEDFIFNVSAEINKTINFYLSTKPNERISKIYITGGTSLIEGIKDKIYNDTNIDIEVIDPFLLVGGEGVVKPNLYKELKDVCSVAMHLSTRIDDIAR